MNRNEYLDSLKFILMCLVIFGHVIEHTANENATIIINPIIEIVYNAFRIVIEHTTNNNSAEISHPITGGLYNFIYSFHMPLFIFISGYFSKNINKEKFNKSIKILITPYVVFQIILSLPLLFELGFLPFIVVVLFIPRFVLWYIPSLICWRFLAVKLKEKEYNPFIVFSVFVLLGAIIGWIPFPGLSIIIKTVVFAPYFIIGHYCSQNIIDKIKNINKIYGIIIVGIAIIVFQIFNNWDVARFLHAGVPYVEITVNYPPIILMIMRIISYLPIIIISIGVMIITDIKLGQFAKLGSNTFNMYLMQAPIIYMIYYPLLKYFNIPSSLLIDCLAFIIILPFTIWISNTKFAEYCINPQLLFTKKKNN